MRTGAEQVFAQLRDAAADHEQLGVEHGLEPAACLAEGGGDAPQCLHGPGVAGEHEPRDGGTRERALLGARRGECLPHAPGIRDGIRLALKGPTGCILLEASVLTAAARAARRG